MIDEDQSDNEGTNNVTSNQKDPTPRSKKAISKQNN